MGSISSASSTYDAEQILVTGMRSGSRQTFGKLYNIYAPLLFGYLVKMVRDKKAAETILQQAFIDIWDNRNKYNGPESLYMWMQQLTKKIALPYILPDNSLDKEIQSSLSFVNIDNLSIDQKNELYNKILELVYYSKYSLAEASAVLNISADSLKIMLRDAVKNLKTMQRWMMK